MSRRLEISFGAKYRYCTSFHHVLRIQFQRTRGEPGPVLPVSLGRYVMSDSEANPATEAPEDAQPEPEAAAGSDGLIKHVSSTSSNLTGGSLGMSTCVRRIGRTRSGGARRR